MGWVVGARKGIGQLGSALLLLSLAAPERGEQEKKKWGGNWVLGGLNPFLWVAGGGGAQQPSSNTAMGRALGPAASPCTKELCGGGTRQVQPPQPSTTLMQPRAEPLRFPP